MSLAAQHPIPLLRCGGFSLYKLWGSIISLLTRGYKAQTLAFSFPLATRQGHPTWFDHRILNGNKGQKERGQGKSVPAAALVVTSGSRDSRSGAPSWFPAHFLKPIWPSVLNSSLSYSNPIKKSSTVPKWVRINSCHLQPRTLVDIVD